MCNIYYTYAYLREDGTPYYVGKGKGKRAFVKHGRGRIAVPPVHRILFLKQNLTEAEAFKHECYIIAILGRKDMGTGILRNLTDGGEGTSNPSEETRRKRGDSTRGIKRSDETRRKISLSRIGTMCSEETKMRISEAKRGNKASVETRQKMSRKRRKSDNPFYGKSHTRDTKEQWSKLRKGRRWWNDGKGNTTQSLECPGDGWKLGRKRTKNTQDFEDVTGQ